MRESDIMSPVWTFFYIVSEEDNMIIICNTCSTRVPSGGNKSISINTMNLIGDMEY